jgi:hypothetical protein
MEFRFEVLKTDPSGARLRRLTTPHGQHRSHGLIERAPESRPHLDCSYESAPPITH